MVDLYAGIAVSSSAMTAAFLSPVWGSLADKYGRKPMMIRAALAMTFTMGGMAFVPSVFLADCLTAFKRCFFWLCSK